MQTRSLDPFDDSASTRLARMGLTDFNGKPNTKALPVFAGIFSALFYEHSMDCYDNPAVISSIAMSLAALKDRQGYEQMFVFLCLQYDAIRIPIPDPVWWIAGNSDVVREFMGIFTARLCELAAEKEVVQ
jgi:hypothetical protein